MSEGTRGDPRAFVQWKKHPSAHFVFSFLQDSLAERNVTTVASRAEAAWNATVEALGLADSPQERVQVYLSDVPEDGWQSGEGGIWEMGGQRIIAVFLSEAQSEALERAVVELLLTSSLGVNAARTAMLVDGVLGYVAQRTGGSGSSELDAALFRLQSEGHRTVLTDALHGPPPEARRLYRRVVTSFVTFLLTHYGVEAFKRFVREFDPDIPDRASEAAYAKPLSTLEEEWRTTLAQTEHSVLGALRQTGSSALGVTGFLRRAFAYLRPYWGRQLLILLTAVIGAAFTVALPLAFGRALQALTTQNYGELWLIIPGVVVLYFVQAPATVLREYLVARVGANVMNDIRYKMFSHLQDLSANFYARSRPGDIQSRFTNDLGVIEVALTRMLPLLVTLAVTFVASLVTAFVLEPLLALAVVAALPVLFVIPARFGRRASRAIPEQQRNKAMLSNTLQENIGAQQVVKAYGLQEMTLARFRAQLDQLGQSVARGSFLSALPGTSAALSVAFIHVVALAGGAFLVYRGALEVGTMASFQLLIAGVTGPLSSLSSILQMLLQASAGMQRVDELLNERSQIVDAPDARPLGRLRREIRFEDVNFSYTGEQVNLRDVDLSIPAGQSLAFVGPSGSGKSTVLNLIMRFYDPSTGAVTIDGQDLRGVTQESLRSQIGAVFQETFLYNATVRENIRLGKLDATDYEVERAAKAAEIHNFIMTLPRGYDTPVGERGGRLSGGQKQRIAIARALLHDPAILLLDEPTSALDPQTEAAINETVETLTEGRTVITVTHRLASVADADRIVVLERGRVVEQGAHEELLKGLGLYYRLWGQQNGFEEDGRQVEASRLRVIPFFKNLDGDLLSALADRFLRERRPEGAVIFREGEPGDKLYFVDRGEVEVAATGPTGEERRLAVLRDGDYFGEMALLREAPREATVRARTPSVLLSLDRERFLELLRAAPELRAAFEHGVEARRRANLAALQGAAPVGGRR
jgi:ATP-binding cassette subfamily B protein